MDAEEVVQKAPAVVAMTIAGFAFLFGASIWTPGETVHERIETIGMVLIAIHAVGRTWCWSYAHPIDKAALITTGPYSVCRHPQDFFLILGGIGIAALLGSVTSAIAGGLAAWGIVCLRVVEEERQLRASHGDTFQSYRKRVPKFIPNPTLWRQPDPTQFRRASLFTGVLKAWPLGAAIVAEAIIERLHVLHKMPVLFHLF